MFRELIGKVYDNKLKVIYLNNYLNIINFEKILVFDSNIILLKTKEKLIKIKGTNLVITKSYDSELLIKGNILKIEFRWLYEKLCYF